MSGIRNCLFGLVAAIPMVSAACAPGADTIATAIAGTQSVQTTIEAAVAQTAEAAVTPTAEPTATVQVTSTIVAPTQPVATDLSDLILAFEDLDAITRDVYSSAYIDVNVGRGITIDQATDRFARLYPTSGSGDGPDVFVQLFLFKNASEATQANANVRDTYKLDGPTVKLPPEVKLPGSPWIVKVESDNKMLLGFNVKQYFVAIFVSLPPADIELKEENLALFLALLGQRQDRRIN